MNLRTHTSQHLVVEVAQRVQHTSERVLDFLQAEPPTTGDGILARANGELHRIQRAQGSLCLGSDKPIITQKNERLLTDVLYA